MTTNPSSPELPLDLSLDINSLLTAYREQTLTPGAVLDEVLRRIEQAPERNVWICRLTRDQVMAYVDALQGESPASKPLYGIPFVIKDNIDLAGVPTTAACPEFAYTPERHAHVVQCLIEAGAIPVGKTNLDQFATGLVGTRSPYGACRNSFNDAYISGGSSAGSAVAVATGLASFSLGTDTAGSGRVPAAFNNLVGLKPTRGVLSTRGVVPACRTLDCVSIFALTAGDADAVFKVAADYDAGDAYARAQQAPPLGAAIQAQAFRFGVPLAEQLEFFGDTEAERLLRGAVERLSALGGEKIEVDCSSLLQAARLLYEGPWVAERYLACEALITQRPEALLPVTRKIIAGGITPTAAEGFRAQYRLQQLRRDSERLWTDVDVMLTPTTGTVYRIDEVEADPIRLNSNLGYYTNFMNLLDLSAVAVPAGFRNDGLPLGVTLFAPAFHDQGLLNLGDRLHRSLEPNAGALPMPLPKPPTAVAKDPSATIDLAVCGAHMSGLPLNPQLTSRGAVFVERAYTSADYHLYVLAGGPPQRPGLVRSAGGAPIEVEIWRLPEVNFADFFQQIPQPLGLGTVDLQDGRKVAGFLCEADAVADARDITHLGGWRAYLEA